ncbi:hypothetical protein GQ457_14G018430 [Hibiscus cannabinus]
MVETKIGKAKHYDQNKQEDSPTGMGERSVKCCSTIRKKGEECFMNMLCNVLCCCGLFSACYEPRTPP